MLFFGATKKKMKTYTSGKKKVRATNPASAARKIFKSVRGYKSKGPKVVSVKSESGKTFRYRVRLIKIKKTVEIEGKSVTYKFKIKVKAIRSRKGSPAPLSSSSKSATKSKSTKSCSKCKSGKCGSCSIKPASGAWY